MGNSPSFASAGITFVRGWLVYPDSSKYVSVSLVKDCDSAVNPIVEADVLTRGLLVGNDTEEDGNGAGPSQAGPRNSNINLTDEERRKVEDSERCARIGAKYADTRAPAMAIRVFLEVRAHNSPTLAYAHLLLSSAPYQHIISQPTSTSKPISSPPPLSDSTTRAETTPLPQPELFALFCNSLLAVLYRHGSALSTLVTDQVFLNEPSTVGERIKDVDQGAAVFADSASERSTPVGRD